MAAVVRRALLSLGKPAAAPCSIFTSHKLSLQLLNFNAQRGFIDPALLRIDSFNRRCDAAKKRFGAISDEFKKKFIQKLDDQASTILNDDFRAFLYLADKQDMPTVLRMVDRYVSQQKVETAATGVNNDDLVLLIPDIMRKYYSLCMCEDLLVFYNSMDHTSWFRAALVMDLLYENGRYEECLDVAYNFAQKNDTMMFKLHAMGIACAVKLNTADALKKSAFLFDHCQKSEDQFLANKDLAPNIVRNMKNRTRDLRRLIAVQCINQKHYNAALTLLAEDKEAYGNNFIELNIKAIALLKGDRPDAALKLTQKLVDLRRTVVAEQKNRRKSYIFKDLFEELMEYSKKEGIPEAHVKQCAYYSQSQKYQVANISAPELIMMTIPWKPAKKDMVTQTPLNEVEEEKKADESASSIVIDEMKKEEQHAKAV